jgi:hypothetical protein
MCSLSADTVLVAFTLFIIKNNLDKDIVKFSDGVGIRNDM